MKSLPKPLLIIIPLILLGALGFFIFRKLRPSLPVPKPSEKVELTYWGLFEPQEVMQPLIDQYEQENPNVTINYQRQSYTTFAQYKNTLYSRVQSGAGPDIARIHSTWVPQFASLLTTLPSSVMSSEEFESSFYPVASDTCWFNNSYYGIPLMYDGLALVYNKDLFQEASISSPPTTWKDFRDIAVKITQWKDNSPQQAILQAGAAIGASSNIYYASDILGLMLAQSEVPLPDKLDTQAAADVFTFYTNFVSKDHVWSGAWPDEVDAFAGGKVGMAFLPSWEIARLKQADLSFSWGVAPVPQVPTLEGELTNVGWANFWVESVTANSKYSTEAWKFLKFLAQKDSQQKMFQQAQQVRGMAFPYARQDLQSSLETNEYLGPVVQWAMNSETNAVTACSGNSDYDAAVSEAVTNILSGTTVSNAVSEAKDVLTILYDANSLGIESEERVCSLASLGLDVPGIDDLSELPTEAPSPTPTEELTPTPTAVVTATPTEEPTNTPSPQATPTAAPAPDTGVRLPSFLLIFVGAALLLSGIFVY